MKFASPVIPNENHHELILGEHQPQYQNLPIILLNGGKEKLMRVEFDENEIKNIIESKSVYILVESDGYFKPMKVFTEKPVIFYPDEN